MTSFELYKKRKSCQHTGFSRWFSSLKDIYQFFKNHTSDVVLLNSERVLMNWKSNVVAIHLSRYPAKQTRLYCAEIGIETVEDKLHFFTTCSRYENETKDLLKQIEIRFPNVSNIMIQYDTRRTRMHKFCRQIHCYRFLLKI